MKVTIAFRHLEHTPALDARIEEKSERLAKFLGGRSNIHWSCYVKQGIHYAEVEITGPNYNYHATGSSENLYKTIDIAINKIEKQLQKKKEKIKSRRQRNAVELQCFDPEMAWADYDEDYFQDAA
ncbi:ribosomal subunit interface protein [Bacteriovorax sp. BSW11_IV]|uniref:ribosome hibernation-promoting factor, HPF/YfiA family n=1 Tax=Bacteriovorax sp. BSW11_IV TaxID=1353529 RepID=UPI00038A218B|nr:ribosome-associated translation inhibitor RaiA [Bacteriovorax sp. BSW11_IV]EQC49080.1 ribosomal subunit interface protein [Bacteriovorax sp. BSW11_IV]